MSVASVDLIHNHFNSFQSQSESTPLTAPSRGRHNRNNNTNTSSSVSSASSNQNCPYQSVKFQTETLRQELIQNFIVLQTSNLSLALKPKRTEEDDNDDDDDEQFQDQVSNTLIDIINSVLSTIVSSKLTSQPSFSKSDYYDSSICLLEHVASFISTKGDGSLTKLVLNHLFPFSTIPTYESIRSIICTFVGWCATNLMDSYHDVVKKTQQGMTSLSFLIGNDNQSDNKKWRLECLYLIMTDFLVKRLTDKTQTVRNVAIHTSCLLLSSILDNKLLSTDNDCDEDENENERVTNIIQTLIESLMWNVTHDPSFANRSSVLQLFPIEKFVNVMSESQLMQDLKTLVLETIVLRVRDEKVKVRVDAFDVLRRVHVQHDLTVEMRCEILRQGFSTR